mmetsp:Transcript_13146/g.29972  ORF Transcript_13146/g.29972 Transcript_13146/m.29972 type:complete len:469 (+) Transcript_13146:82-1488(+)
MKLPLDLLLTVAATPLATNALLYSSNSRHRPITNARTYRYCSISSQRHYKEPSRDRSTSDGPDAGSSSADAFAVLANTERWISDTLDKTNKATKKLHYADEKPKNNPYSRKEVTYVCETGTDLCAVVGGIFRRVREARELGEAHGKGVEARLDESSQAPTTMRQTQLCVIPNCEEIAKFHPFDMLVQSINQARRSARDFVIEKKGGAGNDWVVSINCAHLHPEFGEQSPKQQLEEMKKEDEGGEIDVNYKEFKRQRDMARRSPYPSVIVEVQSTPPADFGARSEEAAMEAAAKLQNAKREAEGVSSDDVQKLEALFRMSAADKKTSSDGDFYDALGEAFGKKQIASQTPLNMAQTWVLKNDPKFNKQTSQFTTSNTRMVDQAYEYVFNTMAMLIAENDSRKGQTSYIVLPKFVPTSATSFDRFAGQISNIIRAIPSMKDKVLISTYHPEHVEKSTQSPVPILVLTWTK